MYVAIEGVIGVGKTTLARLLQPRFQAELLLEVFEENPFLSDFYSASCTRRYICNSSFTRLMPAKRASLEKV